MYRRNKKNSSRTAARRAARRRSPTTTQVREFDPLEALSDACVWGEAGCIAAWALPMEVFRRALSEEALDGLSTPPRSFYCLRAG